MNPQERGFLLLTAKLGNPDRKVLTLPQFRELSRRVVNIAPSQGIGELEAKHLIALGYSFSVAQQIVSLLEEDALLDNYLFKAKQANCIPITRVTPLYPQILRKRLGQDAPACIWVKGNPEMLSKPKISLVGSRDIAYANRCFAKEVGKQAAQQGMILVSGNARGADSTAQNACLASGGQVISVVADNLQTHVPSQNHIFLSEDGFCEEFTAHRALHRNRIIHALGEVTLVAQVNLERGGTWDGSIQNLKHGWSPVFCFDDGSEASMRLQTLGAEAINDCALNDFVALTALPRNLFEL